jgi:hypothetical protein
LSTTRAAPARSLTRRGLVFVDPTRIWRLSTACGEPPNGGMFRDVRKRQIESALPGFNFARDRGTSRERCKTLSHRGSPPARGLTANLRLYPFRGSFQEELDVR